MKYLSQSMVLRTVTWLALVLAVALAADLVDDLIFEVSEAAAVDSSTLIDAPPLGSNPSSSS